MHSRRPSRSRRFASALALAVALATNARAETGSSPWSQTLDLAGGVGASRFTAALSWNHFYGFFDQRLRIGLGVRFASFFGSGAIGYTTADASLIRANKVNTLTVTDPRRTRSMGSSSSASAPSPGSSWVSTSTLVGVAFGPSCTGSYAATDPRFAGPQVIWRSRGKLCAMDVHVDCYAGHRGEETPRRLEVGGRRVEVFEVLDRWYGPDHRYFKVSGSDGAVYILRHDEPADRWEIVVVTREP